MLQRFGTTRELFVLVGVLLLLGAATAIRSQSTVSTEQLIACGECHSMAGEVQAWQQGAHAGIACLQCHVETDGDWVRHSFEEKGRAMSPTDEAKPLHLEVRDSLCLTCHEVQLPYLEKDLVPPPVAHAEGSVLSSMKPQAVNVNHTLHMSDPVNLSCTDCHRVHGPLPGTGAYREDAHVRCQACHDQKSVAIRVQGSAGCGACHRDVSSVAPPNHTPYGQWLGEHGLRIDGSGCGECHLSETARPYGPLASAAAFPSDRKDACLECHANVTMPHPENYLAVHGEAYLGAGKGTCETCHSPLQSKFSPPPATAASGYCTDCHAQPMPHPTSFLSGHGQKSLENPASCAACHSAKNPAVPTAPHASQTFCAACHSTYQHPQGWVAAHGTQVDKGCAACHTMPGQQGGHNACSACHRPDGTWHEPMWFIKHGPVVNQNGTAGCLNCHGQVEPACSKCHRNR